MAEDHEDVFEPEEEGGVRTEEPVDDDEDLLARPEWKWISREPRRIASEITSTSLGVFTILEEDPLARNFRVYNPGPHQRICTTFHGDGFGMYEFVFKDLRLRLPFSPLAVEIFDYLKLAPSQLHPNSMAFVLAFERLCEYLNVTPTRSLFFRVFRLQRMTKELGRRSWVSLKQRVSLFDMYAESIRGFKSRFYVIRAETRAGREALFKWEVEKNEDGTVKKDEDGSVTMKEVERFPMSWTEEHFKKGTDAYLTADASLTVAERRGLRSLQDFVKGFSPAKLVTRAGEPVLDEEGNEQFVPRLINTKRLLECDSRAKSREVLGT
jgi:hypothetical protein